MLFVRSAQQQSQEYSLKYDNSYKQDRLLRY